MTDLLYFGYDWEPDSLPLQEEFIREVKERFPNVRLEDAWDNIKGYRQAVYLEKEQEEDYLIWAICHGWIGSSFTLQMMNFQSNTKMREMVEKGRELYPECFKGCSENG